MKVFKSKLTSKFINPNDIAAKYKPPLPTVPSTLVEFTKTKYKENQRYRFVTEIPLYIFIHSSVHAKFAEKKKDRLCVYYFICLAVP